MSTDVSNDRLVPKRRWIFYSDPVWHSRRCEISGRYNYVVTDWLSTWPNKCVSKNYTERWFWHCYSTQALDLYSECSGLHHVPHVWLFCFILFVFFFILARLAEKHCSYVDCSSLLPVPCLRIINSYTRFIIQSKIVHAVETTSLCTPKINEPLKNIAWFSVLIVTDFRRN